MPANFRESKYAHVPYSQIYRRYHEVLKLTEKCHPKDKNLASLQRELGHIRIALHEKTQDRVRAWNSQEKKP